MPSLLIGTWSLRDAAGVVTQDRQYPLTNPTSSPASSRFITAHERKQLSRWIVGPYVGRARSNNRHHSGRARDGASRLGLDAWPDRRGGMMTAAPRRLTAGSAGSVNAATTERQQVRHRSATHATHSTKGSFLLHHDTPEHKHVRFVACV
jgi:hypothetical protein